MLDDFTLNAIKLVPQEKLAGVKVGYDVFADSEG